MNIIRKSNISKSLKISVWFGVTKALEKRLDRNNNDEALELRSEVINRITNQELHGHGPS